MASLDSKFRGDSDSDNETLDEDQAPPPGVETPVSDGLPQVCVVGAGVII